jgi:hypothetical protein
MAQIGKFKRIFDLAHRLKHVSKKGSFYVITHGLNRIFYDLSLGLITQVLRYLLNYSIKKKLIS